ncbi:MAG TPA: hypothetical protein VKF38_02995 [Anaerolineaceae bacterium]|nr:hypothetical protein [Anaerolineaceae bacterium]
MTESGLIKKLRIQSGQRILILNPPQGYLEELGVLPPNVELAEKLEGTFDFIQWFIKQRSELEDQLAGIQQAIIYDALLWICYPKQSSKVGSDLNRDIIWGIVSKKGLEGVTLVSLNEVWSAMRFRPAERVGK